jgi:hypothetical protein
MLGRRVAVYGGGNTAMDAARTARRLGASEVGHGQKAAHSIDAYLRGETDTAPARRELATAGLLNTWYYADAPATMRPQLAAARRITTFDEVVCFCCDNCYGVCPDNAVVKLADGS